MPNIKCNISNIYEDNENFYLEISNSNLIDNKLDYINKIDKIVEINNYNYREEIKNDVER